MTERILIFAHQRESDDGRMWIRSLPVRSDLIARSEAAAVKRNWSCVYLFCVYLCSPGVGSRSSPSHGGRIPTLWFIPSVSWRHAAAWSQSIHSLKEQKDIFLKSLQLQLDWFYPHRFVLSKKKKKKQGVRANSSFIQLLFYFGAIIHAQEFK